MTEPYLGEIMLFGGTFAPFGWAVCDGTVLPIQQNPALFTLLGTQYGGNGQTTFALPDLRGQMPMGQGSGQSLTPRVMGETGGVASAALSVAELPAHTHVVGAVAGPGNTVDPTNARFAIANSGKVGAKLYAAGPPTTVLSGQSLAPVGNGQARNNLPPYQALLFVIALQGIFPSFP